MPIIIIFVAFLVFNLFTHSSRACRLKSCNKYESYLSGIMPKKETAFLLCRAIVRQLCLSVVLQD